MMPVLSMITPEPRTLPPSTATVAAATFFASRTWILSTSSCWAWAKEARGTTRTAARATDFMGAPAESLFLPDSYSRTYNIRRLPVPWDFIFRGFSMVLLPWILCAALAAGGDDKEIPVRRRQLPLSAREAVGLSLNHNL